jgi:hypothetical protein
MANWNEFHSDPRVSYYFSLRRDSRLSARDAFARLRRMDAMVLGVSAADRCAISLRALGRRGLRPIGIACCEVARVCRRSRFGRILPFWTHHALGR